MNFQVFSFFFLERTVLSDTEENGKNLKNMYLMKFCLEFRFFFFIRPIFYILMLISIEIVLKFFGFWWKTHFFYRLEDSDDAEKNLRTPWIFLVNLIFFLFFFFIRPLFSTLGHISTVTFMDFEDTTCVASCGISSSTSATNSVLTSISTTSSARPPGVTRSFVLGTSGRQVEISTTWGADDKRKT